MFLEIIIANNINKYLTFHCSSQMSFLISCILHCSVRIRNSRRRSLFTDEHLFNDAVYQRWKCHTLTIVCLKSDNTDDSFESSFSMKWSN